MGKGFKELLVWQKASDLAVLIYKITNENEFKKDFGLRDQVRRSVVSVPSNMQKVMKEILIKNLFVFSLSRKDRLRN